MMMFGRISFANKVCSLRAGACLYIEQKHNKFAKIYRDEYDNLTLSLWNDRGEFIKIYTLDSAEPIKRLIDICRDSKLNLQSTYMTRDKEDLISL